MNKADMIYDLSSLWASVKEEFPYFDRLPFDWDELYYSFLERLDSVNNEADFHHLLEEFMESLNDGHTKYLPPKEFRTPQQQNRLERPSHTVNDKTLTIKLNDFLFDHSDYVRELLTKNSDAELVRLDIRDNIGGNTFYAANVAKLFISGVFHGCQKWTQTFKANDLAAASQIANMSEEIIKRYQEYLGISIKNI
jgi:C-terminal processing protease CtpA/Prc